MSMPDLRMNVGSLGGLALLCRCSIFGWSEYACVDPKLLRVKVGDTLFDLPNTVDTPYAMWMDGSGSDDNSGILRLSNSARMADPGNRATCNCRAQPIADFHDNMAVVFRGDGSEPEAFRMGNSAKMYSIVKIVKYDPVSTNSLQSSYLADVRDIEKVHFVETIDITPKSSRNGFRTVLYRFSYNDRKMDLRCSIHDDSKFESSRKNPRPAFPVICSPRMPFRAGDIIIAADQRPYGGGTGQKAYLNPPEQWPKQWSYTINKILSYRVKKGPR